MEFAPAHLLADLETGRIGLTDIGTIAVLGGVLGETIVRLARSFGLEVEIDGWREGMFVGALGAVLLWIADQAGA